MVFLHNTISKVAVLDYADFTYWVWCSPCPAICPPDVTLRAVRHCAVAAFDLPPKKKSMACAAKEAREYDLGAA